MGKDALIASRDMSKPEAVTYLQAQLTLAFSTRDLQEGVAAFFERRDPVWEGR
jgi:enoyl-CoA hydratase/carnithine racemase